jgi:hypothetical protein
MRTTLPATPSSDISSARLPSSRPLRHEEVYLNAYDGVPQARRGIGAYFEFFNDERPHQALGYLTPSTLYYQSLAREHGLAEAV